MRQRGSGSSILETGIIVFSPSMGRRSDDMTALRERCFKEGTLLAKNMI